MTASRIAVLLLLVESRSEVGPARRILAAAGAVAPEGVDVLLLLEQRSDERDVGLELLVGHAGAEEGADPVDQLGRRRLLPQLRLLAEPVELDQDLVQE